MLSLPADIVCVLAEWVCCLRDDVRTCSDLVGIYPANCGDVMGANALKVFVPHAGYTLKSLMMSCPQLRNIIYARVLGKFFDSRAIKHVVRFTLVDYYSRVVPVPMRGHLSAAVDGKSFEMCRTIVERTNSKYIDTESNTLICANIVTSKDIFDLLVTQSECLFARIWLHIINGKCMYNIMHITRMVQIRDLHFYNTRLPGAGEWIFGQCIKSSNYDLAWTLLTENDDDIKNRISAVKFLMNAIISECGPMIPWFDEEHPRIVLLNKVMTTYSFRHDWLQQEVLSVKNNISRALVAYIGVKYGIDVNLNFNRASIVDFDVLSYYIVNTTSINVPDTVFSNICAAIQNDPKIIDKLFEVVSIDKFNMTQIYHILGLLIPSPIYFTQVFSQEYVEPLQWIEFGTLELQLDNECRSRGLDPDDRAIIGMYMEDEFAKHHAKIHSLTANMTIGKPTARDIQCRRTLFAKWYTSRIKERYSPTANIIRYLKERSDGEKEQAEINQEQSRIRMNWSRDCFDVAEWKLDDVDEQEVRLKMSGEVDTDRSDGYSKVNTNCSDIYAKMCPICNSEYECGCPTEDSNETDGE